MDNSYVSYLECSISGKQYEANKVHGLSEVGRPLLCLLYTSDAADE